MCCGSLKFWGGGLSVEFFALGYVWFVFLFFLFGSAGWLDDFGSAVDLFLSFFLNSVRSG
jgi:hypothetical protein